MLEIKVLTLKPKLFKQIRDETDYDKIRPYLNGTTGKVLGFVLDNYDYYLLCISDEEEYFKFRSAEVSARKHKQIFLS